MNINCFLKVSIAIIVYSMCLGRASWGQSQIAFPQLNMSDITHLKPAFAAKHRSEGKLWKCITFSIDEEKGEIQLKGARIIAPRPANEVQSTLVLEYETVSGQTIRVPSETPWLHISGADVPTDEDGKALRVYNADGNLIAEYRGTLTPRKDLRSYQPARIGTDRLGFSENGRHLWRKQGPGGFCDLRWSWNGGQTWTDPQGLGGDTAMTWVLAPEILQKLKESPDPLIEIFHPVGLKVFRKIYHFNELPTVQNEAPPPISSWPS